MSTTGYFFSQEELEEPFCSPLMCHPIRINGFLISLQNIYLKWNWKKYRNVCKETSAEFLLIFSFDVAKVDIATTHDYADKILAEYECEWYGMISIGDWNSILYAVSLLFSAHSFNSVVQALGEISGPVGSTLH
jgi:hypothetical protein